MSEIFRRTSTWLTAMKSSLVLVLNLGNKCLLENAHEESVAGDHISSEKKATIV